MKTKILKSVSIVLFMSTSLFSCSSDSSVTNENENNSSNSSLLKPPPPGLPEFFYRYNGVLPYTSVPDAFVVNSDKVIFAMDGSFNVIKIPLSSIEVGTYFIGGSNSFTFNLPSNPNTWLANDGYIKITQNNGSEISGIIKVEGGGIGYKGISSINGYFNAVPIVP
jgi:hypothetical protein